MASINHILFPVDFSNGMLLSSAVASDVPKVKRPVRTSVHRDEAYGRNEVVCRKILCAVGGTPMDIALIDCAVRLAKDMGAALRLVHVVPDVEDWPAGRSDRFCKDEMNEAQKAMESLMQAEGIEASLCVAAGDTCERVCEEARRYGADVVVIGRGTLQGNVSRQSSHIIQQSPCPVLTV